jgi:hypothetical protein
VRPATGQEIAVTPQRPAYRAAPTVWSAPLESIKEVRVMGAVNELRHALIRVAR